MDNSNQVYASTGNKYPVIVPPINNIRKITSTDFPQPTNQLTISPDNGTSIVIPEAVNESNVVISGDTGTWVILTGDFGGKNIPPGFGGSRSGVFGFTDITTLNNAQLIFSTPAALSFATVTLRTNGKSCIVIEDKPTVTSTTINTDLYLSTVDSGFLYLDSDKKVISAEPTVTPVFDDTLFAVRDNIDHTKMVKFNIGGSSGAVTTLSTSAATNRVISLPDITDTLVARSSVDTLVNKTISANDNNLSDINHFNLLNIGTNTHAQIDTHIASTANPHSTTLNQANSAQGLMTSTGDMMYYAGTGLVNLPIGANLSTLRVNNVGIPTWVPSTYLFSRASPALTQTLTVAVPWEMTTIALTSSLQSGNLNPGGIMRATYTGSTVGTVKADFQCSMRLTAGTNRLILFEAVVGGTTVASWMQTYVNTTAFSTVGGSFICTMNAGQYISVNVTELTSNGGVLIQSLSMTAWQIK